MKPTLPIAITFALALAAPAPSAPAQGMPGKADAGRMTGPGYEISPELQRYREMAGLMRDMSQLMSKMQERMAKGEMSPEAQKRMQRQLQEMSDMMRRLAGLADRPTMGDPETRKQTEEMRRQMDSTMRDGLAP
jgi:hypothetical protein